MSLPNNIIKLPRELFTCKKCGLDTVGPNNTHCRAGTCNCDGVNCYQNPKYNRNCIKTGYHQYSIWTDKWTHSEYKIID